MRIENKGKVAVPVMGKWAVNSGDSITNGTIGEALSLVLKPGEVRLLTQEFRINCDAIILVVLTDIGTYTLPIQYSQCADIMITDIITEPAFYSGQTGTISVQIKNNGTRVGKACIRLKLLDMIHEEKQMWLMPGETGTLSCGVNFENDLESGTYTASLELWQDERIVNIKDIVLILTGIRINVAAKWDKIWYNSGDVSKLMLLIENNGMGTITLQARVQEQTRMFEIGTTGTSNIIFDVHVDNVLDKLQYGIYTLSNRALYLDACYLRKGYEGLVIVPEMGMYLAGATMSLTIIAPEQGTLSLYWFENTGSYTINGTRTVLLKVPEGLLSGSYPLKWGFGDRCGNLTIDVKGLEVQVNDTDISERLIAGTSNPWNLRLKTKSNQGCRGLIKVWLDSPVEGRYIPLTEKNVVLDRGINSIIISGSLTTAYAGMQRIIYGIYVGDLLCASGVEWVDVIQRDVETCLAGTGRYCLRLNFPYTTWIPDVPLEGVTVMIEDEKGNLVDKFNGRCRVSANYGVGIRPEEIVIVNGRWSGTMTFSTSSPDINPNIQVTDGYQKWTGTMAIRWNINEKGGGTCGDKGDSCYNSGKYNHPSSILRVNSTEKSSKSTS